MERADGNCPPHHLVYWRVSYALDLRLNNDLRAEAAALAPLVTDAGTLRDDPGLERTSGARRYQVLDPGGRVLSSGSDVGPGRTPPTRCC